MSGSAARAPVSACIITFNEERNLKAALDSVAFADEIIVVDSRSSDRTREIAAGFRGSRDSAPRVIERDWPGHVEQKNYAIDQASNDWVLCIDADERVTPELRAEVEAALSSGSDAVGYTMPRRTRYLGRWIRWGGWYPDRKLRLFRRSRGRWGGINPHDHVQVEGRVTDLSGDLLHFSYRGIEDHIRTIDSFTDIAAREKDLRGTGRPLLGMIFHPPLKFLRMYILKQGFREGRAGLIIALLGALYVFLKYAKLWELRSGKWREEAPAPAPLWIGGERPSRGELVRVLHLISNHKLTGPVDPAIRLARALFELNVDSRVAVGRPANGPGPIDDLVRERGLEPVMDLRLPKHRRLLVNRRDSALLGHLIEKDPLDVLHAHLDNAHGIAARARRAFRKSLGGKRRPLVVRSLYDDTAPRATLRARWLHGREADGVFVFGEGVRADLIRRFGLPEDRVVKIEGSVVLDRFHPRPPGDDLRERFGIPRESVVIGIVARIQRHRRYELLLEAVRRVAAEVPEAHLLVLGRGTRARELAHDPVKRLGLEGRVSLPGYVGGEDYPRALACFDVKVFLVPGTDGTCRAVRESMAMGIPVVATRRGFLPEIVRDGVDGFIIDEDVDSLARALRTLAGDRRLRQELGANARLRATTDFSQRAQAEKVLASYRRWLSE